MSELVQLSEITKVYQGGVTGALNGVSLTVEEGEFTAVMGPSGRGKTTPECADVAKTYVAAAKPTTAPRLGRRPGRVAPAG